MAKLAETVDVSPFSPKAAGIFRLVDPKIALASFVPFLVGISIARSEGAYLAWELVLGALVALFAIEVSKNAVNDLFDFRSGADTGLRDDERTPFSGGKRVLVDGLLTEEETAHVAVVALLVAIVAGSLVAFLARPTLLLLGAAGALVAIAYTAPPFKLCYRGLGELAVLASYGPGIVLGTVLLFRRHVPSLAVGVSVVLGLLVANVLLVNELPDERADRAAGKRTLVVRLGRPRAVALIGAVFALAFSLAALGVAFGQTWKLLAMLAGVPPALAATLWLSRAGTGPIPVRAQVATLLAFVLGGGALAVALVV